MKGISLPKVYCNIPFFLTVCFCLGCSCRFHRGHSVGKRESGEQVLEGFRIRQDEGGRRLWELISPHVTLEEDSHTARMMEPHMKFFQGQTLAATLEAKTGIMDTQSQEVHFSTQVTLISKTRDIVLNGDSLVYLPSRKKIISDEPVVIRRRDSVTNADGLEANPDLSEITFKKQRTLFRRPPRSL